MAAGDRAAVKECLETYGSLVWSIARRFTESPEEAEDAAQEIFIELWKHAARYDPRQGSQAAFICVLGRRQMLERLRRSSRRPQLKPMPDLRDLASDQQALERSPEAAAAATALAALDPRQRRALALAFGQGLRHSEISEITGMPPAKVKSLLRRALVAVRKRLLAPGQAGAAQS